MGNQKRPCSGFFPGARISVATFPDALIEASCLACVAAVPILYDPHGALAFQPMKASFFRALAIVCLGGFVLQMVWRRGRPTGESTTGSQARVILAAIGFVLATAVSSLCSVVPWASWWGLAQFNEGFFTRAAWVVLFLGAIAVIRTRGQADRLLTVALAASLPVALFAIFQKLGLDPGRFLNGPVETPQGDPGVVNSFAGNPIFTAGYLGMLVPVCLSKIRAEVLIAGRNRLVTAGFAALLVLQVAAIFATQKRGPLLSLALTAFLGIFLVGVIQRRVRWVAAASIAVPIFAAALVVLAILFREGMPLTNAPFLAPLARIVPVGREDTGDTYRRDLWGIADRLLTGSAGVHDAGGKTDALQHMRPLVGYGPETIGAIHPQVLTVYKQGPDINPESRYHNLLWDTWHASGFIGLVCLISIVLTAFLRGCGQLNLWSTRNEGRILAAGALAGGTACALLASIILQREFAMLGFQLGFLAGLAGSVALVASKRSAIATPADAWFPLALICGLAFQWLHAAFIFETGNTSALFWIFAGLLCSPALQNKSDSGSSGVRGTSLAVLLTCLILAPVIYGFIDLRFTKSVDFSTVLRASFLLVKSYDQPSLILWAVVLPSFAGVVCLTCLAVGRKSVLACAAAAALILGLLAFGKAVWIAQTGPLPAANSEAPFVLAQAVRLEVMACAFIGGLIFITIAIAAALTKLTWPTPARCFAGVAVAGASLWAINLLVLTPVRAEVLEGWGLALDGFGRQTASPPVYAKALSLLPGRSAIRIELSNALLTRALTAMTPADFTAALNEAAETLRQGRQYSGFDQVDFYLGRLLATHAFIDRDPENQRESAVEARTALARFTTISPLSEPAWFLSSVLESQYFHDPAASAGALRRAGVFVQSNSVWADYYNQLAASTPSPILRAAYAGRAADYYDAAVVAAYPPMWKNGDVYRFLMTGGTIRRNLGQTDAARTAFSEALKAGGDRYPWEACAMLAHLSLENHDPKSALTFVDAAITGCPERNRPDLLALRQTILLQRGAQ